LEFQYISRKTLENGEFQYKIPGQTKFKGISRTVDTLSKVLGSEITLANGPILFEGGLLWFCSDSFSMVVVVLHQRER